MATKVPKTPIWPFPPATGAVAWSKKQIAAYNKSVKPKPSKLPEAPF